MCATLEAEYSNLGIPYHGVFCLDNGLYRLSVAMWSNVAMW